MGIVALQGAVSAHARVFTQLGAVPVELRRPEDLPGVDAVVLPGGESTTMSMLLESSGLLLPLLERLRQGMPALGTCAGMILLATEVLDGRSDQHQLGVVDIAVRRNAFGRQVDSFETDLSVPELGGAFPAVFIRAPVVERAGPGVEVLAELDGRPVMCRQAKVWVTAFHPELSGDFRLHRRFLEDC
ncbi:MAG: pyridoxal 5'-phosphate synthase glutaminase subunit PdxT [Acidimicrobiales bacterium]